jgi:hypothetical protein
MDLRNSRQPARADVTKSTGHLAVSCVGREQHFWEKWFDTEVDATDYILQMAVSCVSLEDLRA